MPKLLAAALLSGGASALLWHPKNPKNSMWDTWLFAQPEQNAVPKFYMNYLSSCDASCGGSPSNDPTGCCGWNGVGATISNDGVHYEDQGIVVHKDAGAKWLGSGSVLKNSAGEYVMNFSEEYDCQPADPRAKYGTACQSIFFATSKDLKNWTRLAFKPPPANDTEVFKVDAGAQYAIGGRWDCISTVPKPGSPGIYYGFWTASPSGHGGAGVGETTDQTGHHWQVTYYNMPQPDTRIPRVLTPPPVPAHASQLPAGLAPDHGWLPRRRARQHSRPRRQVLHAVRRRSHLQQRQSDPGVQA